MEFSLSLNQARRAITQNRSDMRNYQAQDDSTLIGF
jgi:hypothetical protein